MTYFRPLIFRTVLFFYLDVGFMIMGLKGFIFGVSGGNGLVGLVRTRAGSLGVLGLCFRRRGLFFCPGDLLFLIIGFTGFVFIWWISCTFLEYLRLFSCFFWLGVICCLGLGLLHHLWLFLLAYSPSLHWSTFFLLSYSTVYFYRLRHRNQFSFYFWHTVSFHWGWGFTSFVWYAYFIAWRVVGCGWRNLL